MVWKDAGPVTLDNDSKLKFPAVAHAPAIYRLKFETGELNYFYVGETLQHSRRMQGYRKPGPSQETNRRLNQEMIAVLRNGGRITVQTLKVPSRAADERGLLPDLYDKNVRMGLEQEAINALRRAGVHLRNR
jgi:hypothetical protein